MVDLSLLIVPLVFSTVAGDLRVLHEWKYIDYLWKNAEQKQEAIDSGSYNSSNIFAIDVDRARDGRFFVTTPRQSGVPATLSTVSDSTEDGGPLLKPYPNWDWNQKTDCTGIISVFRVTIDECNGLWVLDTGKNGDDQVCPAQVLRFDLRTNRMTKRIEIPSEYSTNEDNGKGLLIALAVEAYGHNCEHIEIYMADSDGYGLVVYNGRELRRFSDQSFNPDANHMNFTIAGESFQLADGIFSLVAQPRRHDSHSAKLFYRPLASLKQYYVSTRNFGEDSQHFSTPNYKTFDYTYPTQVSVQDFSYSGILFMGYTNPPAIACWNSHKPMNDDNVVIVAQDEETLQFTSGLKLRRRELFLLTNRYQKIMAGTQNFDEVNFRILAESDIRRLVRDTACQ